MKDFLKGLICSLLIFLFPIVWIVYHISPQFKEVIDDLIDDVESDDDKPVSFFCGFFPGMLISGIPVLIFILISDKIKKYLEGMYPKITLTAKNRPYFQSFEDAEKCLRGLGTMEFLDISKADLAIIQGTKDPEKLVKLILNWDYKYLTKRISKRFKIHVKSGVSENRKGRNRSAMDLFLIASHYHPEITLREVYEGLAKVLENYVGCSASICSTIYKRVYNLHGNRDPQARTTGNDYHFRELVRQNKIELDELNIGLNLQTNEKNHFVITFCDQTEKSKVGSKTVKVPTELCKA